MKRDKASKVGERKKEKGGEKMRLKKFLFGSIIYLFGLTMLFSLLLTRFFFFFMKPMIRVAQNMKNKGNVGKTYSPSAVAWPRKVNEKKKNQKVMNING